MAHSDINWVQALPLVLLGIRSALKEDIKATSAEMVYGETLRLPFKLLSSNLENKNLGDPSSFLSSLREFMSRLRPTPASRHCQPGVFVFKELSKCSHAFLKQGPFLKALQPPYTGPYEVMDRNAKTITLKICNNKPTKVSIDRVKPAFILQDDVTPVPVPVFVSVPDAVPTEPIPVPVSIPDSVLTEPISVPVPDVVPTEPTQVPERTTRFGRRVKFRDILNLKPNSLPRGVVWRAHQAFEPTFERG
ncbi:uncharacterized protein LOC131670116 [Phymastichus coffea]|uniref:uncharacterized protein LOC131670116 n=1 Tax=Phymastichus coffea TaxID=108790 RepID=UPI00273AB11A|nr:uncharacterized protein LOC131670116 [Phymastichus coffea]